MDNVFTIRKLELEDVEKYRNMRLELLQKEPQNFGSSFEEENNFDGSMWNNRLTKKNIIAVGAFASDQLIGIALGVMNPRKKIKHVATLNSFYVRQEYRGKGVGTKLVEFLSDYLTDKGVEIIHLSVVTENQSAINLYKKLGYVIYGEELNSIKLNDRYINQYLMSKSLID